MTNDINNNDGNVNAAESYQAVEPLSSAQTNQRYGVPTYDGFFKEASSMTEDVRKNITTPAVQEAFERAKLSARLREMYKMEDGQYIHFTIYTQEQIEKGYTEGYAEGFELGRKLGIIQQMRKDNTSDKEIIKRLGLSNEKFEEYVRLIELRIEKSKAEGIELGIERTFCTLIQQMRKDNTSDNEIIKWLGLSNEKFEEYMRLIK